jgi:5-phospho-D-xylono-1,4-lactonase
LRLVGEGHGQQILLAGDLARRSYWPSYGTGGGPGLTYILWRFVPWLRAEGLPETAVQDLLVHNPARALAIH